MNFEFNIMQFSSVIQTDCSVVSSLLDLPLVCVFGGWKKKQQRCTSSKPHLFSQHYLLLLYIILFYYYFLLHLYTVPAVPHLA